MPEPTLPVIPEYITVHLGKPSDNVRNVQVSFRDYIKNVASSEIYPTWPESALRANIYAQISFALNRIYTEWYRSKGYDFDITNSTQFDQAYNPGRDVYENISLIVDEIFNDYVTKQDSIEPYFAQFCNGTTVTCNGLSQWGTVDLANRGYTPYRILTSYYGNDINIVKNAPVENVVQSYKGAPLKLGSEGNDVRTIQIQLNRIRQNFPSITEIQLENGNFGVDTENAVKTFQRTFSLTDDGIVGKSTWYKIKNVYNGVKQLSELTSEGVSIEEVTPIYPSELKRGMTGNEVLVIQYYLSVIGYFNAAIPILKLDGIFGENTESAVKSFQREYGLPETGVVDAPTWNKMSQVYTSAIAQLPPGYEGERAEVYPGYSLSRGMRDRNVQDLQTYLAFIADANPNIPKPGITGFFGDQTYNSVLTFQKEYGLKPSGTVGPITWNRIAKTYDQLKGF